MSGLTWTSYSSNSTLDAGYYTKDSLYNNAITFFTSSPTAIASGSLTTLQLNSGASKNDSPPFTTFSPTDTEHVAIQFSGYFCPDQTGDWTIYLGPGETTPCDDFGVLFLAPAGSTITPDQTFTIESDLPSATLPFIRNIYNSPSSSKTVYLIAGGCYPILVYYNQGRHGYNFGLGFSFDGNFITDFSSVTSTTDTPPTSSGSGSSGSGSSGSGSSGSGSSTVACFKEDTKILTENGYVPIQDLRKGDLVKTYLHDYKPISMIGKREIHHPATTDRIKNQLYKCCQENFPELDEDLIITGCHSILVDNFKDEEQREKTIELNGKIYITDDKYRLSACLDERASVYENEGDYDIYHLTLDHEVSIMNYGIYANGLLVESCCEKYMTELANMSLIE